MSWKEKRKHESKEERDGKVDGEEKAMTKEYRTMKAKKMNVVKLKKPKKMG